MRQHQNVPGFEKLRDLIVERTISKPGKEKTQKIDTFESIKQIEKRQDRISAIHTILIEGSDLPLGSIPDVTKELEKAEAEGSFLPRKSFRRLYKLVETSIKIENFYQNHSKRLKSIESMAENIGAFPWVLETIDSIIDDDGRIRDDASQKLLNIKQEKNRVEEELRNEVQRAMQQSRKNNWLHEEKPTIRNGRYVIPLKSKFKRKIDGIVHGESGSGATTYVEPMSVIEVNNKLKSLEQEEEEEIKRILVETTSKLRPNFDDFIHNIEILANLDSLRACAIFAVDFKCNKPLVVANQEEQIYLTQARHPLLSLRRDVVPLNFDPPEGVNTVIITGPNAGGKTVAMKTIGLLTKMAMCGLFIPASENSVIPFTNNFLVDIGDKQSIEDDLSTFSAHVDNLKTMLQEADYNTLVLIDELGTGTDPIEGSALGQAILEELLEMGTFTIATTHHSSLKAFGDENKRVVNAAMEFDTEDLNPLYRLKIGFPGNSYALEIADRLGLDKDIIKRARKLMDEDTVELDNMLTKVEEEKARLEREKEEVRQKKQTLDNVVEKYDNQVESIKKKQQELDKSISEKIEEEISEARSEIEKVVKEIREKEAEKESIKKAHKTIDKLEEKAEQKREKIQQKQKRKAETQSQPQKQKETDKKEAQPIDAEMTEGIWVEVIPFNQKGKVKRINGNKVAVDVNGKVMQVQKDNVRTIAPPEKKQETQTEIDVEVGNPSLRLSIRGMRYEEAEVTLRRYLDRVVVAGLSKVEILHGKGEGVLRKLTHDMLKKNPNVAEFYHRNPKAGGSGVTVVKF